MKKTKIKNCKYCNGTGKVWDAFLGNYVPCETENDCELLEIVDSTPPATAEKEKV